MMIPVLIGVMFIIFVLDYIRPGCPSRVILGEAASPEAIARVREELRLDDPFLIRFGSFVGNALTLDFGRSWQTNRPVFQEIFARFPNTMQLAGMSVIFALLMGVPLGILSATKQYSIFDIIANFTGLLAAAIPNFWLGMMMVILFGVNLRIFPTSGWGTPMHWVMPVVAIGASSAAIIMRMTRSSMLECIRSDYIRTARAKGQKESVVIFKHALRNALIPVTTVAGLTFGALLGGAVLTETIFAIPGLGRFMVEAISQMDQPLVQGGVLLIAISFSLVNLLVDILYAFIDPRIRSQYR